MTFDEWWKSGASVRSDMMGIARDAYDAGVAAGLARAAAILANERETWCIDDDAYELVGYALKDIERAARTAAQRTPQGETR